MNLNQPAQRRSDRDRSRRGSILIFVVGILVLLALAATAYLSTARNDRVTSTQNEFNVQVDLLLQGVVNAAKAAIMSDGRFNATANTFDAPATDTYLAQRLPVPYDITTAVTASTGNNPAVWGTISGPLFGTQYSDPLTSPAITYTTRVNAAPTTYTSPSGQVLPGFQFDVTPAANGWQGGVGTTLNQTVPAMDTDQDGIADAGMVKLPVGVINGLTYYYGMRIVDNNSAVNANTAWMPNDPTVALNPLYGNFFPSNIDLVGMLSGAAADETTQITALNLNRSNNTGGFNSTPIDDNGAARTDFVFAGPTATGSTTYTSPDALWNQLGRRLANPGFDTAGVRYAAMDINQSTSLAGHFVIRTGNDPQTTLETALQLSLVGDNATVTVPIVPYKPDQSLAWYNANFNFPAPGGTQNMPLRSILTTSNPTGVDSGATTADQTVAKPAAFALGTVYNFGTVVSFKPAGATVTRNFVCIQPHTSAVLTQPDTSGGVVDWALVNWVEQPQKINVNTADFGELWWGFRRVMAGPLDATLSIAPFTELPTSTPDNMAQARMFRNSVRDPDALSTTSATYAASQHLTASQMLQLRTAIAAVNAMDLRDAGDDITARRVGLYDNGTVTATPAKLNPVAIATVYGTERQPYITEVYVNNESDTPLSVSAGTGVNPKGYVAIELFNPYPVPLNLNSWTLGVIDRRTNTYPLRVNPVMIGTELLFDNTLHPNKYVVPANGYLVLENFRGDVTDTTTVANPNDALNRPKNAPISTSATCKTAYVPNLSATLYDAGITDTAVSNGGELMLLRPRVDNLDTGVYALTRQPADAIDPCDEGVITAGVATPNIYDFVPVDSFDFSSMAISSPSGPFTVYHYLRANDATLPAAAGKYTIGQYWIAPMATQRQGAAPLSFSAGAPEPAFTPVVALGVADAAATTPVVTGVSDQHTGIQIHAADWPSPKQATTAMGNVEPFGSFAREADMLQIPFIGAYKLQTISDLATVNTFHEWNALPVDESFADDGDTFKYPYTAGTYVTVANDDTYEQVGRFCTLSTLNPTGFINWPVATAPADYYDFARFPSPGVVNNTIAPRSVFDIFTVASPLDATLPAVSADEYAAAVTATSGANYSATPSPALVVNSSVAPGITYGVAKTGSSVTSLLCSNNVPAADPKLYQGAMVQMLTGLARGQIAVIASESDTGTGPTFVLTAAGLTVAPAAGDVFRILSTPPEHVGTSGLININTASWFVLNRLPMVLTAAGTVNAAANATLAKEIVAYRDGNPGTGTAGAQATLPFRSIADINRVVNATGLIASFQTADGTVTVTDANDGKYDDLSPGVAAGVLPDNVAGDFENRYLMFDRICNLITTRSDTFTVYIELQGWRDAGQPTAQMVTDRHVAFIADRSGLTPVNTSMNLAKVP